MFPLLFDEGVATKTGSVYFYYFTGFIKLMANCLNYWVIWATEADNIFLFWFSVLISLWALSLRLVMLVLLLSMLKTCVSSSSISSSALWVSFLSIILYERSLLWFPAKSTGVLDGPRIMLLLCWSVGDKILRLSWPILRRFPRLKTLALLMRVAPDGFLLSDIPWGDMSL